MVCGLSRHAALWILVSQPGMEPVSPALDGRFLTAGPLGRSLILYFYLLNLVSLIAVNSGHAEKLHVDKCVCPARAHTCVYKHMQGQVCTSSPRCVHTRRQV